MKALLSDMPAFDRLASLMGARTGLWGSFDEIRLWLSAHNSPAALEAWAGGVLSLVDVGAGAGCLLAFWRASRELAPVMPLAEIGETGRQAALVCREAGGRSTALVIEAFVRLGSRLGGKSERGLWWQAFHQLSCGAPGCVEILARHADSVLVSGHAAAFADFVEAGLKASGRDRRKQTAFFGLEDPLALSRIARIGASLTFSDLEPELKMALTALWSKIPNLQPLAFAGRDVPSRVNIAGPIIRLPEVFPDLARDEARRLYHAAAAHAGAHLAFGGSRFPIGTFKPMQMALVTLVEDARVEELAMRRYPGLRRLWSAYHTAEPQEIPTARSILMRVARGLFDRAYRDPDALVGKAQYLFEAAGDAIGSSAVSLDIGTRLANDMGQRRIRFDERGHVVEPVYRDDGLGLWDFSTVNPEIADEIELTVDAARIERREAEYGKADQPAAGAGGKIPAAVASSEGVVVATYPEWDVVAGAERSDWTTVREMSPILGDVRGVQRALERVGPIRARIARLVRGAKVGRVIRLRRQMEGHDLDIDAAIDGVIARRAGEMPDPRMFRSTALLQRDLAVLVLIDVSRSTASRLADGSRVLDMEKLAVAILGEALRQLGDPVAIMAFASAGRTDVRVTKLKGFGEPFDADAIARLAGLTPGFSTRLGTVLRHGGAELDQVRSFRKLLLVLTDGEPFDIDSSTEDLIVDARRVVLQLRTRGIDTFGVTLDPAGAGPGGRIFGKANAMTIRRIEDLPMRLSELYFRLARR